ncbi:MAG: cytochrome-c oxidase, cbb3-type subunit II [Sulfitobacter litoralis]|jgi:cytochrome c oxidase cbb3-type subunit 2|uniref:cytochrome-c oxidase, cbb3-type subunit II n=1 Tax=Sulfitobacter TaxID=60136 RepID=UPI001B5300B8|nr:MULTISPECIES: cytochrome-c oxidase, cbb3-type subunit II [Sulfitobacter]MBQ0765350.1 cytochrome-c oxidase, cbb3-type subunit II [Sulfitobacter litoralis]MCF7726570.1 cytochrome-c oxidase, cbb3-type subunit II [Sulfitobacter sp. M22]MCF7777912.1 cytochrome-c oxidase, cbb3-type subunit II [Sulfitobacter sp. M220]
MAHNSKITDPAQDPNVSTLSDAPQKIPNELPHHTALVNRHAILEKSPTLLLIASLLVVSIGGIVEIAPLFWLENTIEKVEGVRPYSPLELTGRDIYVREGCYLCHSQMIRPMRDEVERYGHYSLAAESMYDHPFQWGSKRTGPDVARVGGRYSDAWHVDHLSDPQSVVPESIMPKYAFLSDTRIDADHVQDLLKTHRFVGVPYTDEQIEQAASDFKVQADPDADYDAMLARYPGAAVSNFDGAPELTEMDALIAYLQVLGTMVDFSTFTPDASR